MSNVFPLKLLSGSSPLATHKFLNFSIEPSTSVTPPLADDEVVVLGRTLEEFRHPVSDDEDVVGPELRVLDLDAVFFEAQSRRIDLRLFVVLVAGPMRPPPGMVEPVI
ncbi:MAG: hypothetical protein Q3Y13_04610 [Sutterella sp.]|nr:hypothetical protein [Sutterella sp.]